MATGERIDTSLQTQDTKLPSIAVPTLLNDFKTCPKCENGLGNGFQANGIHSTLAYSRCRCHRDWKYDNIKSQNGYEPSYFANSSTRMMQKRFGSAKTRCSSALHPSGKSFEQFKRSSLVKPRVTHKINLPALKLTDTIVYTINATEPDNSSNTVVTANTLPSNTSLISSSNKLIEDDIISSTSITKLPEILKK